MALYFNLPVYKESYELLLMIFQNSSKLPKNYKYTLGERLKMKQLKCLSPSLKPVNQKIKTKQWLYRKH